jgi:hypothetical protein
LLTRVAARTASAGVDDLRGVRAERVDQGDGFLGRLIGQAEDDQVHLAHDGEARGLVLALLRGDAFHREAGDLGDAAADLESGRAGLPVDEDGGLGFDLGLGLDRGLGPRCCLGAHGDDPWKGGMQQKSRAFGAALRFSNAGSVRHRTRA